MLVQEPVIKAESFLYYEPIEIKSLSEEQVFPELAENLQSIVYAADNALKETPASVTHKTILPPSADPHDYVSIGGLILINLMDHPIPIRMAKLIQRGMTHHGMIIIGLLKQQVIFINLVLLIILQIKLNMLREQLSCLKYFL